MSKTIIYTFSKAEALSICEEKKIDPTILLEEIQQKPLKELAKKYRIGHVRLSAVLKALGYIHNTSEKIRNASINNRTSRLEDIVNRIDQTEFALFAQSKTRKWLMQHYKLTAAGYAHILRLLKDKGIYLPTEEERSYNAFIENSGSQIDQLVQEGLSLGEMRKICKSKHLRPYLQEKHPSYNLKKIRTPEEIEATSLKLKEIAKNRRNAKIQELLDKCYHMWNEQTLSQDLLDSPYTLDELVKIWKVDRKTVKLVLHTRFGDDYLQILSIAKLVKAYKSKKIALSEAEHPELVKAIHQNLTNFTIPDLFQAMPGYYIRLTVLENPNLCLTIIENNSYKFNNELVDILSLTPNEIGELLQGTQAGTLLEANLAKWKSEKQAKWEKELSAQLGCSLEDKESILNLMSSCDSSREFTQKTGISYSDIIKAQRQNILPSYKWLFSSYEQQINQLLTNLNVDFESHKTSLLQSNKRNEFDFWIPSKNIAIEVNPTYTHNSTYGWLYKSENARQASYHQKKMLACQAEDIELISLYEKDLVEPTWSNVTKPFLEFKTVGAKHILYAREVNIQDISNNASKKKKAREFLERYHHDGAGKAKFYYEITHPTLGLVGVASFAFNPHIEKATPSIELKRVAWMPSVQVRFGLSRIISKFFRDNQQVEKIYSYSRNDMGIGKSYEAAGFQYVRCTPPGLTYVNPSDPNDTYSWHLNTPWSATSGILSRLSDEPLTNASDRLHFIENEMPRRKGNGQGYVEVYNSGSYLWVKNRK